MPSPPRALLDALRRPDPDTAAGPPTVPAGIVPGATLFLAAPLIVALVALASPRWYPLLDMSQIELRLRDVWSVHAPLVGLAGRILDESGNQGSHPGPLGFYVVWPVYRLLGSTSWAMEASAVVVQTVAVGLSLWIAKRRGGLAVVLGLAAALAILLRALGAEILTQPWNPYLPVLCWVVFVLAVWSVCCDDLVMLPVAAVTASLCAQTEVAFLGLTGVLGLAAVGVVCVRAYLRRDDADERRRFVRVAVITAGVTFLVWLPPIIEELTSSQGNLSILFTYFTSDPPEATAGFRQAVHELAVLLNPATLLTSDILSGGRDAVVPGYLFAATWAASAVVAWRLRIQRLVWLHAVIALALVAGLISISRIFGVVWYYLILWGWGLNALMLFAVGWTVVAVARRRLDPDRRARAEGLGRNALVGLAVVVTIVFGVQAAGVSSPTPRLGAQLGEVLDPTVRALEREWGREGSREDEQFLVTFFDPRSLGSQGFGLVNELEREGFDVGLTKEFRTAVVGHRVVSPAEATAVVHLAVGSDIEAWRARPEADEVAYSDVRSREERRRHARLREELIDGLQREDLFDLVPDVDGNLFGIGLDPRVPERLQRKVDEMGRIGLPIAIFVAPPDTV